MHTDCENFVNEDVKKLKESLVHGDIRRIYDKCQVHPSRIKRFLNGQSMTDAELIIPAVKEVIAEREELLKSI